MHYVDSSKQIRRSQEIAAANAQLVAAFRSSETLSIAALYAPDAAIIPASATFVVGPVAIARFWQSLLDLGGTDLSLLTIELADCGPYASEIGQYTVVGKHSVQRPIGAGRYLSLWRMEHGRWVVHRQICNCKV